MARPNLPTLTWTKTAVTALPNCTAQDFLSAVRSLLGTTTHWEDKNGSSPTDPSSNAFAYLEIGAKAGTAAPDQRVTLAFRGTSAFSAGSMGWYNESGNQVAAPNSNVALYNYQPEGGSVSFGAVDQFSPYTGKRSLGWFGCTNNGSALFGGSKLVNVWIIESAEVLALCIENDTDNTEHGFIVGPQWVGASTAPGDIDNTAPVINRLWGQLAWPHSAGWNTIGWSTSATSQEQLFGIRTDFNNPDCNRTMAFDPVAPTKGLQLMQTPRAHFQNHSGSIISPTDQLTSHAGVYVGLDVNCCAVKGLDQTMSQPRYFGTWRQIRQGRSLASRVVIESGGSDAAIVRGSDPTSNTDSIWFTNS